MYTFICSTPSSSFCSCLTSVFLPPPPFFSLDFLLSTCPSLFAAVHPPPSILVLSPGSVAVLMKLTDISSLAVDSLERAKAYGDYLPIKAGPQDQHALCQQLQASLNSQSLLSWNILSHFSSLGDCRSTSTFLPLSAFLVCLPPSMSYPPTIHICFLFLSLSFSISLHRPHLPSGNYGKICNSAQRSW